MRASHLWNFVEEVEQGILTHPLKLIFPLRLWHAIHVVHGGSDLQPLTPKELLFIEDIMCAKFSFLSTKEARGRGQVRRRGKGVRLICLR